FIMDQTVEVQEHQQAEDDVYRTMFAEYPDIVGRTKISLCAETQRETVYNALILEQDRIRE
ncbi:hypothetical protein, partial [Hominenteromicrobium sp.]|uniref:hypothetical protein n=1 Tax=Hominenteromicrobium sp. TaxID=3073581 RepID=UPI003AF741DD